MRRCLITAKPDFIERNETLMLLKTVAAHYGAVHEDDVRGNIDEEGYVRLGFEVEDDQEFATIKQYAELQLRKQIGLVPISVRNPDEVPGSDWRRMGAARLDEIVHDAQVVFAN